MNKRKLTSSLIENLSTYLGAVEGTPHLLPSVVSAVLRHLRGSDQLAKNSNHAVFFTQAALSGYAT